MLSFPGMIYTMKEKVIESFLLSSTLMDDTGQLVLNVNIQMKLMLHIEYG